MTATTPDVAPSEATAPDPVRRAGDVPDAPWGQPEARPAIVLREVGAVTFRSPEAAIAWAACSNPLRLKAHDPGAVRGADTSREERLIAWSHIKAILGRMEDRRRLALVAYCTRTENLRDIAKFMGRREATVKALLIADLAEISVRLRRLGVCE